MVARAKIKRTMTDLCLHGVSGHLRSLSAHDTHNNNLILLVKRKLTEDIKNQRVLESERQVGKLDFAELLGRFSEA